MSLFCPVFRLSDWQPDATQAGTNLGPSGVRKTEVNLPGRSQTVLAAMFSIRDRKTEARLGTRRLWLGLALCTALAGCYREPDPLGDRMAEAKQLFQAACSQCHPLDIPLRRHKTAEGWRRTVSAMRQRGAQITGDEAELIARYLAQVRGV